MEIKDNEIIALTKFQNKVILVTLDTTREVIFDDKISATEFYNSLSGRLK